LCTLGSRPDAGDPASLVDLITTVVSLDLKEVLGLLSPWVDGVRGETVSVLA
jgi:hypothetical protein